MSLSKKVRWTLLWQTLGQEAKGSVRKGSLWNKYGLMKKAWVYISKQLTTVAEDTAGKEPVPYY